MQPKHAPPPAWLVVESAPYAGRRIALSGKTLAIGSDPRCHLHPPDVQIAPVHATIHFHDGHYYVKDQHSGGRTFINSERVDLQPLCPDDVLVLGGLRLRFEVRPAPSEVTHFVPLSEAVASQAPFPVPSAPTPTVKAAPVPVSAPAPTAAPAMTLPPAKHQVSWAARLYSLSMLLVIALVGVGLLSVVAGGGQSPALPAGFDPATASPVTLLYFYADWCTYCRQQGPIVDGLANQYAGTVTVLYYDTDNPANGGMVSQYGAQSIPTTVVLDQTGSTVASYRGLVGEAPLRQAIDAAMTGGQQS